MSTHSHQLYFKSSKATVSTSQQTGAGRYRTPILIDASAGHRGCMPTHTWTEYAQTKLSFTASVRYQEGEGHSEYRQERGQRAEAVLPPYRSKEEPLWLNHSLLSQDSLGNGHHPLGPLGPSTPSTPFIRRQESIHHWLSPSFHRHTGGRGHQRRMWR